MLCLGTGETVFAWLQEITGDLPDTTNLDTQVEAITAKMANTTIAQDKRKDHHSKLIIIF